MNVRIADSAVFHIEEAYEFYENQEAGAGSYFLDCVTQDIDRLGVIGGVYVKRLRSYYKMNCSHHPFVIYYSIEDQTAIVKAVLDGRKHPTWIKRILSRIKH